jgi:hypothetical protein
MWAGQNMNDYRNAIAHSNQMKALGLQEEQNKLADYSANQPVREAERLSKTAGFNNDVKYKGDILAGQAQTGREQVALGPERIKNQLSQWMASQSKWKQEEIDRHSNNMEAFGESLFNVPGHDTLEGMSIKAALYKQLRKQYPDPSLPEEYSPEAEQKVFQQYQMAKTMKQIAQERELAKVRAQGQTSLAGHEIDAASRLEVEKLKLKQKQEAEQKVGSIDVEINKLRAKAAKNGGVLSPAEQLQLNQLIQDRIGAQAAKMVAYGLPPQILNQGATTPEAIGAAAQSMARGANAAPATPSTGVIDFNSLPK